MKIDGNDASKPKGVGKTPSSRGRIEPVTEAEMERWSPRQREQWAQLSEEDRVLWKLIYDEVKGIMQEPGEESTEPSEQTPVLLDDAEVDMAAAARGLMRALMEEWEQDRWEEEEGLEP